MHDYRVQLDSFCGPMDLLLYLVRKHEVDITNIPIAELASQYSRYVRLIEQIDPDSAAEFIVLAATLMEIKSRCILPAATTVDPSSAASADPASGTCMVDPRGELVRQLLEYKDFRDRALLLDGQMQAMARRHPRGGSARSPVGEVDLADANIFDLLSAFERVMAELRIEARHDVVDDDTPLAMHMDDVADRLLRDGPISFSRLFEARTRKAEVIGIFLAVLELMKQRRIAVELGPDAQPIVRLRTEQERARIESAETADAGPAEPHHLAESTAAPRRTRRKFDEWLAEDEEGATLEPVDEIDHAIRHAAAVLASFRLSPHPATEPMPPPDRQ